MESSRPTKLGACSVNKIFAGTIEQLRIHAPDTTEKYATGGDAGSGQPRPGPREDQAHLQRCGVSHR